MSAEKKPTPPSPRDLLEQLDSMQDRTGLILERVRVMARFLVGVTYDGPVSTGPGSIVEGRGLMSTLKGKQDSIESKLHCIIDEQASLLELLGISGDPVSATGPSLSSGFGKLAPVKPSYSDKDLDEMLAGNGFAEDLG